MNPEETMKTVSRSEYEDFIKDYPTPLITNTVTICDPPLWTHNDFNQGAIGFDAIVASWSGWKIDDDDVAFRIWADMDHLPVGKPLGDNLPHQKFPRGTMVRIADDLGNSMRHFPSGLCAIVEYTYGQRFGGDDADSYGLILLNDKAQPFNSVSWYHEHQLTQILGGTESGIALIEKYRDETD